MSTLNIASGGKFGETTAAEANAVFGPVIGVLKQDIENLKTLSQEAKGEAAAYGQMFKTPGANILNVIKSTGASPGIASALQEFATNQAGGRAQITQGQQQIQVERAEGLIQRLEAELGLRKRLNDLQRTSKDLSDQEIQIRIKNKQYFIEEVNQREDAAKIAKADRDYEAEIEQINNQIGRAHV